MDLIIVCCWVIGLTIAAPKLRELQAERRCGQRHIFAVTNTVGFLPDELALQKALEAAALQEFDTNRWKPETYSRTKAPDGTNDRYLCRNVIDDNKGLIKLTNASGKNHYIQMTLTTNTIECVVRNAQF